MHWGWPESAIFFTCDFFLHPLPPPFPVNIHFKFKKPASFLADKAGWSHIFSYINDKGPFRCGVDSKHSRKIYSREKRQGKPTICWAKDVVTIRGPVIPKHYSEKASWLGNVKMAAFKHSISSPCVLFPGGFLEWKESAYPGQWKPFLQIYLIQL